MKIKRTIKAGNSSAVVLPKSWLNKEVRVELADKTPNIILTEVIDLLQMHLPLENVVGIYLVGSYARGDQNKDSDIDVLVITGNVDKHIIKEGMYNILIISSELLKQKLEKDLLPVGPMIKEAKPLLNSDYIRNIDIKVTEKNVKWYIDTTIDKLKIIKGVMAFSERKDETRLSDIVAYTLVLRIRTLYIINKLIEGKPYTKKDFIKLISSVSKGENAYVGYLAVKNNAEDKKLITIEEASNLYSYLENQLKAVKRDIN